MLLDELERERGERLEHKRVNQLMREHSHLELERELQCPSTGVRDNCAYVPRAPTPAPP